MPRHFLLYVLALTVVFRPGGPLWAARGELIPESTAARHGLSRRWFAQVELDQSRARLRDVILYEGVLYAQTDAAMVHALDAETGKTLWSKRVGRPKHPSMAADARDKLLAVINGSRLYVVDRFNGEPLYETEVRDAPGAGPALSSRRAYVPTVAGMMIAYRVDRKSTPPLFCQSFGRALVQPLVTREYAGEEYVVWSTDRGHLNFGRVGGAAENTLVLKYRLETGATIVARPAYLPPDPKAPGEAGVVFVGSCDGFVYAIQEETGETLWRFSTGEPIRQSPVVIDDRVYVTTELSGMYCLEAKTGKNLWWAAGVRQFVAAGKARVYAVDRTGRLLALSADDGARLDTMATEKVSMKMANADTDRIYLVGDGGLVQCLHEAEQTEPLMHGKDRKEAAKAEAARRGKAP